MIAMVSEIMITLAKGGFHPLPPTAYTHNMT